MILVTGFGPFRDVDDNPSARLVRALHGRVAFGHRLEGRILDVRWAAPRVVGPEARRLGAAMVLGFGVATGRTNVQVERFGRTPAEGADVEGHAPAGPHPGEPLVDATVDVDALAEALGAGVSDDAGAYVCNAWIRTVVPAVDVPAAFVHVPTTGMDPDRLVDGLSAYLRTTSSRRHRESAASTS